MRALVVSLLVVAGLSAQGWTSLGSWSGSGTKETESFAASSREWRLTWTAEPADKSFAGGQKTFAIDVMKEGTQYPVSSIQAGASETKGESFVRGAGRYYLKVSSLNAKWTIQAEQAK